MVAQDERTIPLAGAKGNREEKIKKFSQGIDEQYR